MACRAHWLCLACLAGGLRAAAAEMPDLPGSPAPAPTAEADAPHDLVMAASCIERGEETAAVTYLSRYVADHPDRVAVRAYLAELLWRRGRLPEARAEFERFIQDAQLGGVEAKRLVHGHTRLIAIAEREGDAYTEHLHRGIGLYLVARHTAARDAAEAEGLYCKAAGELTLAQRAKPDAARPHWYLHLVWAKLGQSRPAAANLAGAVERRLLSDLTPAERRDLDLATASRPSRR
jgi:tetratricopeptide (TPR) repeat protein